MVMASSVRTLNVAVISSSHSFSREGSLWSPASPSSPGFQTPVGCFSPASSFLGQRVANPVSPRDGPFSPRESSSGAATAGARAYAATEENTRSRFTPGAATKKNLYDALGVSKTATPREIKDAYRLAARRLHPDVVPEDQRLEATKAFLEVQETYSILSDRQSRAAYDLSLSMQAFQSGGFSNRGPASVVATPSWGFVSSPVSSSDSYSSNFSFKGRSWETDQCW